ncbi:glycerol-3-phosphate dehydrogenase [Vibrio hippocampi]|uniref:Aerobic glycerol-3-phosphate dehydrogenase n=1 Tax=Vibrio hippocampi TaxID=654686 RepID=A0ABM8ZNW9_9VIBR|nr:glycerol-3-phosphate dehydrogenase [Vibrio hippocampi]CAH0530361.1 Aerobic glycerol-3-phosphate dehydrogenase [Vibrio hippocampi]
MQLNATTGHPKSEDTKSHDTKSSGIKSFDIIVIGGGINGAGIAAECAAQGLKVALFEAKDFACATSSASSKLIHGGLRYLEHYEFRLVSEALAEREVLLQKAPHIAYPMRFCLPHRPFLRPKWMIRCGLFLYDHLGKRTTLPASQQIRFPTNTPLKSEFTDGFEYSDCWVDDARLVMLNILAAKNDGAWVCNYSRVDQARREGDLWQVEVTDQMTKQSSSFRAKAVVNAAGPWVEDLFQQQLQLASPRHVRLIQGSHIVVPRLAQQQEAYILQNADKRIVFVIPYLDQFSMIGTTDVEYQGDPYQVTITDQETDYLLDVVNQHFTQTLSRDDIIWSFSGVRPLCEDESSSAQAVTRDYTLEMDQGELQAPLLSIFGGKLTTYRKLAMAATEKLRPCFPAMLNNCTQATPLPGGDLGMSREQYLQTLTTRYPWLNEKLLHRYFNQFGSHVHSLLYGITCSSELGLCFSQQAGGVYQCEIDYLLQQELAMTGEDVLWRRTKLGLYLSKEEADNVTDYVKEKAR